MSLMTPGTVEAGLGAPKFFDGVPEKATVDKLYDQLAPARGVDTVLNGTPATSIEALRLGFIETGADLSHKAVSMDKLLDSSRCS